MHEAPETKEDGGGGTERTRRARKFWDASAQWNIHRAIADNAGVRDEATRERAFDESGELDAGNLVAYVTPGARVVDLGCGIGRTMRPLAPLCSEIVGVDISEKMIAKGREYLAGVPNARLVHTNGAELPTLADGSVDFLYSLICLIHVDKRTAFRYLREIRRVLAPEGLALLQFENLLSSEGMAEFQRVVDLEDEYPLEFYTREEVRQLARAVGFEVLHFREENQFLFATLMRGSPAEWIRNVNASVALQPTGVEGIFSGEGNTGRAVAEVSSRLREPFALQLHATLSRREEGHCVWNLGGQVLLRPGARHRLELLHEADGGGRALLDGQALPLSSCRRGIARADGPVVLAASLTPPGFADTPETARMFPGFYP